VEEKVVGDGHDRTVTADEGNIDHELMRGRERAISSTNELGERRE
jgi:hypothetical protein